MAPRNEQNDRELNTDINAAIAGTEDEIFRDAMEDDIDDNDGDRSLEEMGDGLEGDPLDEDDINVEDTEGPEAEADEEDAEGDEEDEDVEDDESEDGEEDTD
jgi:segregation and condensation protein B